jgi:CsoR family transcriptional regulator, copper-sensing transcriptional repressor
MTASKSRPQPINHDTDLHHHDYSGQELDGAELNGVETELESTIEPLGLDHSHGHTHVHSEESLRRIVNRLSRIEGHVRGIKTMVQGSHPCPDVLIQVAAVRGALDRVARIILDEHLTECVARAAQAGNMETEIENLKAALDRFLP